MAKATLNNKGLPSNQVFINTANGSKGVLIEGESAEEIRDWTQALERHITFANSAAGSEGMLPSILSRADSTMDANQDEGR